MNSIKKINLAFLPHVSLIPPAIVYKTFRRHPIFPWHKTHMRSVLCELVVDPCTQILITNYTNKRTYGTFLSKKSAEHYLDIEIPEFKDVGKLCIEKARNVTVFYICMKCGCLKSHLMEIVFIGPFDIVTGPITTTTNSTCPNCNKASVQMDISAETSLIDKTDQDCNLTN